MEGGGGAVKDKGKGKYKFPRSTPNASSTPQSLAPSDLYPFDATLKNMSHFELKRAFVREGGGREGWGVAQGMGGGGRGVERRQGNCMTQA